MGEAIEDGFIQPPLLLVEICKRESHFGSYSARSGHGSDSCLAVNATLVLAGFGSFDSLADWDLAHSPDAPTLCSSPTW